MCRRCCPRVCIFDDYSFRQRSSSFLLELREERIRRKHSDFARYRRPINNAPAWIDFEDSLWYVFDPHKDMAIMRFAKCANRVNGFEGHFFHRECAAFLARAVRCFADILDAATLPPFLPSFLKMSRSSFVNFILTAHQ